MTGIRVSGLRKEFAPSGTVAVDGVDLEVPTGAFLVLLGPSGCGKTTTLRMLAGLEDPTGGEIRFGETVVAGAGTVVPPGRRDAGLVFQSYALWPHMTVRANVEWPLTIARMPAAQRRERIAEVLDLLAIGELADRYPGEISGGQQQRVAIARMIAPNPSVLLFDEPLSNLDAKLRAETRTELLRVHRATGATSVFVTHDQIEAMTMATHVALMRDGRVEQFGTPAELLADPATDFVATFMGTPAANVLDAVARDGRLTAGDTDLGAAGAVADGTAVRAMYRPESLRLGTGPGPVLHTVFAEVTPLAGRMVVTGVHGDDRISVVLDERPEATHGDPLPVVLPACPDRVFDAATGRRIAS
ncbi:ABC transporter ATP-binding protein [Pseudonocardia nematodicida]|uniref:ABC transporter ATP-binding protein n=1 Tax=Pseudonocardia nematodicida TaxID=1206997 RepID=A0ABV1KGJ8_9PSEU